MDAASVRLRKVVLLLAALAAVAAAIELVLLEHWGGLAQWAPWITLGVVAVAIGSVALVPTRPVLVGARVVAGLAIVSAAWGFVEHTLANRDFAAEIHPEWDAPSLFWAGITGKLPALAPLAVAFPALLVGATTLGHPGLHAAQAASSAEAGPDTHLFVGTGLTPTGPGPDSAT